MATAVLSMIGEEIASMMIGTHEDREGIVGDRIVEPLIGLWLAMLEAVVEIRNDVVRPCVRFMIVLDTNRILPKAQVSSPNSGCSIVAS